MQSNQNLLKAVSEAESERAKGHLSAARVTARKSAGLLANSAVRAIETVGVVGAGTMGLGIAVALISAGLKAKLLDANVEVLRRAVTSIDSTLERSVSKGRLSSEAKSRMMADLQPVTDITALKDVDLVIEAAFEAMSVKQKIFSDLDRICRPQTILATNTSTLDIDIIAAATRRPQDVIGMHFFSPANIMQLLEIVCGAETSDDVKSSAMVFGDAIGKTSVLVGNCYGFAGNRMVEGFSREANYLLLEGVEPNIIDAAIQDFGMSMGPFAIADLVGIDVPYRARQENPQIPDDETYYRMADLLVELERFGQKSGRGYYLYNSQTRKPEIDPGLMGLANEEARRLGVAQKIILPDEIVARCIFPIINEGAKVLEEEIAARASDLDLIFTLGYGFPENRGGPMFYADQLGLPAIVDCLRGYEELYGAYWTPSALLLELAESGRTFADYDADPS